MFFFTKSLTKQGCLLSLFHFNIVLLSPAKAIKHEAKIRAVTTGEKNIKNKITRD